MCLSFGGSYLVVGATDGTLSIFELGRPKGERFSKQVASFQGRPNVSFFRDRISYSADWLPGEIQPKR